MKNYLFRLTPCSKIFTILLTFCSKGREPSRTNSHLDGTSKGELIPVNSLITPSLANFINL